MYKEPTLTCIQTEQDVYKRPIINGVQRTTRCICVQRTDLYVWGHMQCTYTTHRVSMYGDTMYVTGPCNLIGKNAWVNPI